MNQYGIDINTLEQFIGTPINTAFSGGEICKALEFENKQLWRISIQKEKTHTFIIEDDQEVTVYLEKGRLSVNGHELINQQVIRLKELGIVFKASEESIAYIFKGVREDEDVFEKVGVSFDVREKYWGSIESIVSRSYAGKRMVCKKGSQSSLEFHCNKVEGYYVHSGTLLVRVRAGRGEDRYFQLSAGMTIFIPPGLMHQRAGLEDTVIIELSSADKDSDSFLVEDGQKVAMPHLGDFLLEAIKKRVCEANKQLGASGLVMLTEGNVSEISFDRRYIVIKPSGVKYENLTPENMVVVDADGNPIEGSLKPSTDTPTHCEVYRKFPKIGGIVHTHSTNAVAFAQMEKSIPCLGTTHADAFHGDVPVTRSLTDSEIENDFEKNTGKAIVEILEKKYSPAVLVWRHGPFCFGGNGLEAVKNAMILEKVANIALLGSTATPMPVALQEKHFQRKNGVNRYYGQG